MTDELSSQGRGQTAKEVAEAALNDVGWGASTVACSQGANAVIEALHREGFMVVHVSETFGMVSAREELRSELIRQHLAGECK